MKTRRHRAIKKADRYPVTESPVTEIAEEVIQTTKETGTTFGNRLKSIYTNIRKRIS